MSPHRAPAGSAVSPGHLSTDLRLACLRIARRNRFESVIAVAPHQTSVLVRIEQGMSSARAIAHIEKTSHATTSRTIATLVAQGWVTRSMNPDDGRRVDLTITEAGRRVLAETRVAGEEWMSQRLRQLTPEELDQIEAALPALEKVAAL